MAATVDTLRDALQALADGISDTLDNADADYAVTCWYGAAKSYENAMNRGAASYNVAGRSFSFESAEAARQAMIAARAYFDGLIGQGSGNVRYVDVSGGQRP